MRLLTFTCLSTPFEHSLCVLLYCKWFSFVSFRSVTTHCVTESIVDHHMHYSSTSLPSSMSPRSRTHVLNSFYSLELFVRFYFSAAFGRSAAWPSASDDMFTIFHSSVHIVGSYEMWNATDGQCVRRCSTVPFSVCSDIYTKFETKVCQMKFLRCLLQSKEWKCSVGWNEVSQILQSSFSLSFDEYLVDGKIELRAICCSSATTFQCVYQASAVVLIIAGIGLFTDRNRVLLSRLVTANSEKLSNLPQPLFFYVALGLGAAGLITFLASFVGWWTICATNYWTLSLVWIRENHYFHHFWPFLTVAFTSFSVFHHNFITAAVWIQRVFAVVTVAAMPWSAARDIDNGQNATR